MDTVLQMVRAAHSLVSNREFAKAAAPWGNIARGVGNWFSKAPVRRGLGTAGAGYLAADAGQAAGYLPAAKDLSTIKDQTGYGGVGAAVGNSAARPIQTMRAMFDSSVPDAQPTRNVQPTSMRPGSAKRLPSGNYEAKFEAPGQINPTHKMRYEELQAQQARQQMIEQMRAAQQAQKQYGQSYGQHGLPVEDGTRDVESYLRQLQGGGSQQQSGSPNRPPNIMQPQARPPHIMQPQQSPWGGSDENYQDPQEQQRMDQLNRVFGYY